MDGNSVKGVVQSKSSILVNTTDLAGQVSTKSAGALLTNSCGSDGSQLATSLLVTMEGVGSKRKAGESVGGGESDTTNSTSYVCSFYIDFSFLNQFYAGWTTLLVLTRRNAFVIIIKSRITLICTYVLSNLSKKPWMSGDKKIILQPLIGKVVSTTVEQEQVDNFPKTIHLTFRIWKCGKDGRIMVSIPCWKI